MGSQCLAGSYFSSTTYSKDAPDSPHWYMCKGKPDTTLTSDECYRTSTDEWIKFTCEVTSTNELRNSFANEDTTQQLYVHITVIVVALLILSIIGIIVGYLMHKRKKRFDGKLILRETIPVVAD